MDYTEYSGQVNCDRNDNMFLKLFQYGMGPHVKIIIDMSLLVGNDLNEILTWVMS